MRIIKSLVLTAVMVINIQILNAQSNWCGQVEMEQQYFIEHPEKLAEYLEIKEQMDIEALAAEQQRGARSTKVIPVVFHVLHLNGPENISTAQIMDQMRIMNEDYNKGNSDLSDVVSAFVSVIGDVGIEFRLAKKDPSGNPTTGIDRIYTYKTNQGGESAKLNYWDRKMYLNVWVVKNWDSSIPSSVLAYSRTPAGAQNIPTKDGVIIKSQFVGSIGSGTPQFARTLPHEVGHYLNLSHTWGGTNNPGSSANCNTDDGVSDTPNCMGTFSCNTSASSCGSLDNIQNHMDYADCTVMFTVGQGSRMISALNSPTAQRNHLSSPGNLTATGVNQLSIANFKANRLTVCQYDIIDFSDASEYDPVTWSWTFPDGQAGLSYQENPQESYSTPGLYDVSLNVSNGSSMVDTTKVGYIMVNPMLGNYAPFSEDFSTVTSLNHEHWYGINHFNDEFLFVADPNNGYSNSNCIRLENFGNSINSKDELLTTTFDLRIFSAASISFKVAYAQKTPTDISKLTVYISNDCGETWAPRWSAIGPTMAQSPVTNSYFVPSGTSAWKTITVGNLSGSVLSQTSQFKFVFENKNGNNLYIDDVNITGSYTDVAQLKFPLDGMVSRPNNQPIKWKAIGGVDSYEYKLDSDANFTSGNLQTGTKNSIGITDGSDTQYDPSTLINGLTYYWKVRLIKGGQPQTWSNTWSFTVADNGVSTEDLLIEKYQVQVYPNPMKDAGVISFTLENGEDVTITISDIIGKSNISIAQKYFGSGTHLFNLSKMNLTSGIYVVSIKINNTLVRKKFIVQ